MTYSLRPGDVISRCRVVVDHIAYLTAISLLGNYSRTAIDYLLYYFTVFKLCPDSFLIK